jgi:hypothetical protein
MQVHPGKPDPSRAPRAGKEPHAGVMSAVATRLA